jgi:hypothetical protein
MTWHDLYVAGFALVCWLLFNAIGGPLLRFFDLRTEVRRTMISLANVRARWKTNRTDDTIEAVAEPPLTEADSERLTDAQLQYRELASQMRAFADTRVFATVFLGIFGFSPRKASAGLLGLSNSIDTYGQSRASQVSTIEDALKFPRE